MAFSEKIYSGEELAFSARLHNRMVDAVRETLNHERDYRGRIAKFGRESCGIVPVLNADEQDLSGDFPIAIIDDILVGPDDNFKEFCREPAIAIKSPSSDNAGDFDKLVIVQGPLAVGAIGKGLIVGVSIAKVVVNSTQDKCARPCQDSSDHLESAVDGPAKILWLQSNVQQGDAAWAIVELPSAVDTSFWAVITGCEEVTSDQSGGNGEEWCGNEGERRWKYTITRLKKSSAGDDDRGSGGIANGGWESIPSGDDQLYAYNINEIDSPTAAHDTPGYDRGAGYIPIENGRPVRVYPVVLKETTTEDGVPIPPENQEKVTEYWFAAHALIRQEVIIDVRINVEELKFEKLVAQVFVIPGQDKLIPNHADGKDPSKEESWIEWHTGYRCALPPPPCEEEEE